MTQNNCFGELCFLYKSYCMHGELYCKMNPTKGSTPDLRYIAMSPLN